jgi:beta-phosphoglucomutase-like phosphatase (HAD superfamily)
MAEEVLTQIGALEECRAIAAGDEVANGKPAPDVFLLAAERLEIAPDMCLAIEDSVPGCQSASAAGMLTVAVPNKEAVHDSFNCAAHIMTSLLDVSGRLDELVAELRQQ